MKLRKYAEAEKALLGDPRDGEEIAGGAAGYYLLGTICEQQTHQKKALKYFLKAIELDPTLWVAFEKICNLETNINPISFFSDGHPKMNKMKEVISSKDYFNNLFGNTTLMVIDAELEKTPLQKTNNYSLINPHTGSGNHLGPQSILSMTDISPLPPHTEGKDSSHKITIQTPQNPAYITNTGSTPGIPGKLNNYAPQAPHKDRHAGYPSISSSNSMKGMGSEDIKTYISPVGPAVNPFLISASRSNGELDSSPIGPIEFSTGIKLTESRPGSSPFTQNKANPTPNDLLALLRQFAVAYHSLATYNCSDAITLFKELPKNQYNTGWTLCQIGRALFEVLRYADSEKIYSEVLKIEPYRLEGLEYHSTCLWHLKKQVELCKLANYALDMTLYGAETWCVVGNSFSLQKEHETAIKFFKRAIQLRPDYAYSYTLCAHEYAANEDFEKAKKFYQKALSIDDRHYNAWWGLGNIYLKQEHYGSANQYFRTAIQINPRSSVLST